MMMTMMATGVIDCDDSVRVMRSEAVSVSLYAVEPVYVIAKVIRKAIDSERSASASKANPTPLRCYRDEMTCVNCSDDDSN